jgi:sphingomyelin phosphodiesterase acid-like 3
MRAAVTVRLHIGDTLSGARPIARPNEVHDVKIRLLPLLAALSLAVFSRVEPIAAPQSHTASTVPVLMLSDIHLDPFHDPAKVAQLRSAPVTGWAAILNAPPSLTQAADFAHLQSTCNAKGVDTPIALLNSSLRAVQKQQPTPLFVTVSGDLMAHQFDCRFHTLAPTASSADYSAFAAKTVAFVALQLHRTFPHSPIYFALGNNDSGCNDYREDPSSAFLQADAQSFAADALNPANRDAILSEFPQLGDYNIALPVPIEHTRLLVLQNIFESKKYTACNGTASDDAATAQITWLRAQLTAARAAHEHVWVMAHIPPGIDAYSTFSKHRNVCGGQSPETFLGSEALVDTLTDFPDVIRLALFGHTHMDELRAYKTADGTIPGKLVPSITPVDGNNPAFTLAEVEPSTATLKDYTVFAASNKTGIDTTWSEEYRYSTTYNLPDLSGDSLAKLTSSFLADKSSATDASRAYERFYFVGEPDAVKGISAAIKAAAMQVVWPTYSCSITSDHIADFRSCVCPASPAASQ